MVIRELRESDIFNGFLDALENMSDLEGISPKTAKEVFKRISNNPDHYIYVVEEGGQVVSTVTLLIEPKFIHNGGRVGHIEDVSTQKGHEGKGYASALLDHAEIKARKEGCYKMILDCGKDLESFYSNLGYEKKGIFMRKDLT